MTEVTALAEGRCRLAGELTFATAAQLWRELERTGWLHTAVSVDLAGVEESDSAGLALLVAWRASCLEKGHDLGFVSPPQRLLALARLTDAESILLA